MEDKETLEYFLSILDEAEHIFTGDVYAEKKPFVEYSLKESENKTASLSMLDDEPLSVENCRGCQGWRERLKHIPSKIVQNCSVLCIMERPERLSLLSEKGEMFFNAWFKGLGIPLERVSLTTLIKCPVSSFSDLYADACKDKLRQEMGLANPRVMLLLGENVARYMTRKNLSIEALRGNVYKINHIPTVVTYSPEDLVRNYSNLRAPIWSDLQLVKGQL